ncbi:MAG TPA: hypothetical protein VFS63_11405 [Pseudolabrys sp.]|jgi:hypothetical protein|nr:hypothetical protein [Pseudolabrys sp.]HVU19590.1 hypothetical protein [Rhizomicrobium sp.]
MAFFSYARAPVGYADIRARETRRPGIFRRMARALIDARKRQADRAVAAYLARTGGKLTDSVEREIERRFYREPQL